MAEKQNLLTESIGYKPFRYPKFYEYWEIQQKMHWLPSEISLSDDVQDWNNNLTSKEKNLLTQIFRFFVEADVSVQECYMNKYSQVFKPIEVKMALTSFSNIETVHIVSYSNLLDTVGMPETEYSAFLNYKEMKDKYDHYKTFNTKSLRDIARTLAAFGAFTEGVQLFASFAILLNFPRFNKMKGMGQIISLSVRDEDLHCQGIIHLFRTFIQEHPRIWDDELKSEIYQIAEKTIELEDAFIDLAFEQGGIHGITPEEVKLYIRYICDRRLIELGMKNIFKQKVNPFPWIDYMVNAVEHTNFFENKATSYAKAATTGTWGEAFQNYKFLGKN